MHDNVYRRTINVLTASVSLEAPHGMTHGYAGPATAKGKALVRVETAI